MLSGRPTGRYAGYRQGKRWNEVYSQRDWCIFQIHQCNPCPHKGREGNNGGLWAVAHNRKLTLPLAPTDRQGQGVNPLGLSGFDTTPRYLTLCQSGRAKAAVVERWNRIIKTKIWAYLSDRGTVRWVDVIQALGDIYNHSRHRSICMAPADVQKEDENLSWVLPLRWRRYPPYASNSAGSQGAGQQPQNNFWQGIHAQLDQGGLYGESGGAT